MKVHDVMNRSPSCVRPHDPLNEAARVMWEHDCGWVPVIDDGHHVVGVITDRDICMAAYTRGMSLDHMAVEGTMSTNVFTTRASEPLENALALMRNYRVRRLPVVGDDDVLVGLVSLGDVSRRLAGRGADMRPAEVVSTLSAICEPRSAASPV